MILSLAGIIAEASFQAQPDVGDAVFRGIPRRRLEFPDADSALYQLLTPVAAGTYTYDQFTSQIRLDTVGLLNENGDPCLFARLFALQLSVQPYRPDLPASGYVAAAFTALFAPSSHTHTLYAGDICLLSCGGSGTPLNGSTALALTLTAPVNLAIELILIGTEA